MAEEGQKFSERKSRLQDFVSRWWGGWQTQQTQQDDGSQQTGKVFETPRNLDIPRSNRSGDIELPWITTQYSNTLPKTWFIWAIEQGKVQGNVVLPWINDKKNSTITNADYWVAEGLKKFEDLEKRQKAEQIQLDFIDAKERQKKYGNEINDELLVSWEQWARNWRKNVKWWFSQWQSNTLEWMANRRIDAMKRAWFDTTKDEEYVKALQQENLDYKKKIWSAFKTWQKNNVNQNLVNEYDGKTFTELARSGDWQWFKYKFNKLLADNISLLPNIIITAINTPVWLSIMGTDVYIQESENEFQDLMENGATYDQAKNGAFWYGMLSTWVELWLEKTIWLVWPASRWIRWLFKKTIKEWIKETYKTLPEIIYRAWRAQLKSWFWEWLEEFIQQIIWNRFVNKVNPDRNIFDNVRESAEAWWVMWLFIPWWAVESVVKDTQTNKKIDMKTDLEAMKYVMEWEERKAQRLQQAKENMRKRFLENRQWAETWSEVEERDNNFMQESETEISTSEDTVEQRMIDEVNNRWWSDIEISDESYQRTEKPSTESPTAINQDLKDIKDSLEKLDDNSFFNRIMSSINKWNKKYVVTTDKNWNKSVLRVVKRGGNKKWSNWNTVTIQVMKPAKKSGNVSVSEFTYTPWNLTTEQKQWIITWFENWWKTGNFVDNTNEKYQLKYEEKWYKPWVANKNEKSISWKEWIKLRNKINDETIEQLAKKYWVKVEVIKWMIKVLEGGKWNWKDYAYGKYIDQLLTLSEQIKESTAPHELLHAIFDMIDPETKAYLISQVMKSEGWSASKAEEWLADSFSNFFRTGKIESAPKSTWGKIKIFFKRVRSFINGLSRWRSELEEIFSDIITSEWIEDLQGRIDQNQKLQEWKARMKKRFMEYAKNAEKMQKKAEKTNKSEAKYQEAEQDGISALQKIANWAEYVRDAMNREDLKQYGGETGISFYWGEPWDKSKKYKWWYGISHIAEKHGADTLLKMIKVLARWKITRYAKSIDRISIWYDGYTAILSLSKDNWKETRLVTGRKDNEKKTDGSSEVSTQSTPTQTSPTFSRTDLGAVLSKDIIYKNDKNANKNDDIRYQTVYHWSPAEFEKFDSSHMWEWEWWQAHGWWHYVAVEESTWRHYAEMKYWPQYKGQTFWELTIWGLEENQIRWVMNKVMDGKTPKQWIKEMLDRWENYLENETKEYAEWKKKYDKRVFWTENEWWKIWQYEDNIDRFKRWIDILKNLKEEDFTRSPRNLYEVEIPDPVKADTPTWSNYLEEWVRNTDPDFREKFIKPEQVDKFVNALKNYDEVAWQKLADKMYNRSPVAPTMLWADMYKELSRVLGSEKEASKFLNKIWYDWIHYYWGRDGEAYVIFNDDALEITNHEKYQKAEDDKLIWLHNLSLEKLKWAVELWWLPMPSIAVTKSGVPHTSYGDITFIMKKSAIDPKKSRKNKLYTVDGYTPIFQQPVIRIKNDKETNDLISKIEKETWMSYGEVAQWLEYHDDRYVEEYPKLKKFEKYYDQMTEKKLFDWFTRGGKRRYIDYNLKNIVKKMVSNKRDAFNGSFWKMVAQSQWTATLDKLRKRNYWKADNEVREKISSKYYEAVSELASKNWIWNKIETLSDYGRFADNVADAYSPNTEAWWRSLTQWDWAEGTIYSKITKEDLEPLQKIVQEWAELPRPYSEAKPERAVGWDEIWAVIAPESKLDEVKKILKGTWLPIYWYNEWERMDVVDSVSEEQDLKFQKMEDEYEEAVNKWDTERAKEILREYAKWKGYLAPEDYKWKWAWVAPSASVDRKDFRNLDAIREQVDESYESNLFAIAQWVHSQPDDYFWPMWSRYYSYNDQTGMESYYAIKKAIDSIQTQLRERWEVVRMPEIEVYRAVPDYKKKIASLQKDLDVFTFDKDGNPKVSDPSKLSWEEQDAYARYKDQQERWVIDDADRLLYDALKWAQEISEKRTIKEWMLQSGWEWVTPSKQYAKEHGMNRFDGNYKIIKEKIPADELRWDGNDIREWGFDDGREYVTKPVKNSRKNIEITYDRRLYKPKYDENGNKISDWMVWEEKLIPLSKRFNEKNPDPKYQTVYHWSQAEFDRFDSSHMWEWEGWQAHGWWHYVAVDPKTAKRYADLKHYNYEVEIKWKTITNPEDLWDVPYFEKELYRNIFQEFAMHDYWTFEEDLQKVIDRQRKDYEEVIQHYEKLLENQWKPLVWFEDVNIDSITAERKRQLEWYKDALEKLDELTPDDVKVRKSEKKRHFYEVDIPDPWVADTPTWWNYIEESDKPDKVFIDAVVENIDYNWWREENYFDDQIREIKRDWTIKSIFRDNLERAQTYRDAYYEIANMYWGTTRGWDKDASELLKSLWYDGIHYFWKRDGEAYVIFDDSDLSITNHEKYQKAEYDYDENWNRKWLKFWDNSEFDPSIFGEVSRKDQIEEDKENEKDNAFYNAWMRYNAQSYEDDQLTMDEFMDGISKRAEEQQAEYDQKMRDLSQAQNDPYLLDLQLRAVKLMEEEWKVGKKFWKNVSKEVRERQQREVENKREKLIQDIVDYMYPWLTTEEITYDMQQEADQKEAEWEMLGREGIEEKLKYFKKDKNGNWEAKEIKIENPQIKLEKILSAGKFDEIFTPLDRVLEWKTPQWQKWILDRTKDPKKYKSVMEKINSWKTKTKVTVRDVTRDYRALEKYRADQEAEKERKKKERQEAYAKKKQEEYNKYVRMKAFQKLIDMQWLEKYPFLSEDEIKTRYGFTDEEWKKITEQDEIKLPKKRWEKAIRDFNKAVDSTVRNLIEWLSWQNNMKQREAEKELWEIWEIDVDVLLWRDEEKWQKEVEEFEKLAGEKREEKKIKIEDVKIDEEREQNKDEKKKVDKLIKSTKSDKTVWWSIKEFTSDILTPVSTKIRNISPKIHREVMRYFQNKDIKTNERLKDAEPFLKAMKKIRKENPVRFMDIWVNLANRNIWYANGLLKEYGVTVPTELLDKIYLEAQDVGLNINYLWSYYPLSVKAPRKFLEELMKVNKKDIASEIEKKIMEESQKKWWPLEEAEITAIISEVIAWEDKWPDVNIGNAHMKKRNTEIKWTAKMLEYCDDPVSTLIGYIEWMTQSIERALFLGKSRSGNVHTLADYVYNAKNGLTPDQQDELMDLLKAVFNDANPSKAIQTWRDIATLTTLWSPSSTLTQLWDLSFSVYENGWRETLKAVWDVWMKRKAFDLVDMWVLNRWEEYTNINSRRNLLQKAIHNVFKMIFFSTFDTFWKSTFIQSTWNKWTRMARKWDKQLRKDIMKWTDDEFMTDKIMKDLSENNFSQDVALVMYMKLSNIQPLTRAQMPKAYLNNPNWRLFYQFKTFGIKQLDYVLQETREQTKNFKNLSTGEKLLRIVQIANMVMVMTLLWVGADELKDLTMRRRSNSLILRWLFGDGVGSEQVWEKIEDNVLKLFGLSRYTVMQMKSDPVDALTSLFTTLPATNIINYPFKDIYKAFKDDGSINWRNPASYQLIPIIWKYRYWIYGWWQDKQQESLWKKKKKSWWGSWPRSRA